MYTRLQITDNKAFTWDTCCKMVFGADEFSEVCFDVLIMIAEINDVDSANSVNNSRSI